MKKLLGILGSISLITTSGMAVVACGSSSSGDEGTDENAYNKLISEFNNDVVREFNNLVKNPMSLNSTLLTEVDSSEDYAFLNKDTLSEVYGNSSESIDFYDNLSGTQQTNFKNDVMEILNPTDKMQELRDALNITKYQVLIGDFNGNWISDLTFDWGSAKLQYSEITDENVTDGWISNIKLSYFTTYKYYDVEGEVKEVRLDSDVVITVSNNGVIIVAINDIYTEFAAKLLNDGNDLVYIDYDKLSSYNSNLNKSDLLAASTDEYTNALYNYYTTDFATGILLELKTMYFTGQDSDLLNNATLSYASNDIVNNDLTNNIDAMGAIEANYNVRGSVDDKEVWYENIEWWNLYFGEVVNGTNNITLENAQANGNSYLYNDLGSNWIDTYSAYNTRLTDIVDELVSDLENKLNRTEEIGKSVAFETVALSGIGIKFNDDYTQELSDLSVNVSIAMTNTNTKIQESEVQLSSIFAAYYNGIDSNLNVFHDFYGIEPYTISETDWDNLSAGQKRITFRMTGETGYNDFNIWDYMFDWMSVNTESKLFNEIYGTNLPNLINLNNTIEAKRAKNELISKLIGSNNFGFTYDEYTENNARRVFYTQREDYIVSGNIFEKGLGVRVGQQSWLKWGISTDLFTAQFVNWTDQPRWDYNYGSLGLYTFIGRS